MDQYNETFETWNKVALLYQEKFMKLDLYNESYDYFCDSVSTKNPTILEVGCGPGNITQYLLKKRTDFDILGIDFAPNMIALAQQNNPQAQFQLMDCRDINQLTSKFDGIICGFCLPYISVSEIDIFLNDCYNLLEEKGVLYLSFVAGEPLDSGFKTSSTGDRTYFNYYPIDSIVQMLQIQHFEICNIMEVIYPKSSTETEIHTIIIAKKIMNS